MLHQTPLPPANEDSQPGEGVSLLRIDEVSKRRGCSRSQTYKDIQEGRFPAPLKIPGTSISVWPSSWVDASIARLIREASNG